MTESLYPNKQALNDALDIFRYDMRPFIVLCLERVEGKSVKEAIEYALEGGQLKYFSDDLYRTGSLEESIDISYFPDLVEKHWNGIFRQEFRRDRAVKSTFKMIADARNKVAHPPQSDLDIEYVRSRLTDIADLLERINEPDRKREVESIRDRLSSPRQDSPVPPALSTSREEFCVYTDLPTGMSKIHKASCRYYKNRKPTPLPDNWWHGPYSSEAEARAARQNKGRVVSAGCCR